MSRADSGSNATRPDDHAWEDKSSTGPMLLCEDDSDGLRPSDICLSVETERLVMALAVDRHFCEAIKRYADEVLHEKMCRSSNAGAGHKIPRRGGLAPNLIPGRLLTRMKEKQRAPPCGEEDTGSGETEDGQDLIEIEHGGELMATGHVYEEIEHINTGTQSAKKVRRVGKHSNRL